MIFGLIFSIGILMLFYKFVKCILQLQFGKGLGYFVKILVMLFLSIIFFAMAIFH